MGSDCQRRLHGRPGVVCTAACRPQSQTEIPTLVSRRCALCCRPSERVKTQSGNDHEAPHREQFSSVVQRPPSMSSRGGRAVSQEASLLGPLTQTACGAWCVLHTSPFFERGMTSYVCRQETGRSVRFRRMGPTNVHAWTSLGSSRSTRINFQNAGRSVRQPSATTVSMA